MIGGYGSGKSTYSELITKELNIAHIYTGDMMRALSKQDTDGRKVKELLSKGEFYILYDCYKCSKRKIKKSQTHKKVISLMVFYLEVYNKRK